MQKDPLFFCVATGGKPCSLRNKSGTFVLLDVRFSITSKHWVAFK